MNHNPIGIILMNGTQELGTQMCSWLQELLNDSEDALVIQHDCPRFTTGEGKAVLLESVRGRDVYILSDVTNDTCEYKIKQRTTFMSPDDHYMDIKRVISACGGKCYRITVIMPYLYGGRQDKRARRESLDAALVLRELVNMGVDAVITFDAHNPCVENAVPYNGFDNIRPYYQMIKAVVNSGEFDFANTLIVSPDEGAIKRNMDYAHWLHLELGLFYKVRNLRKTVDGRQPIEKHEYMGGDLADQAVLVADDVLATGTTLLSVAKHLKARGAKHTSFIVTFPQFTDGLTLFDQAYEAGQIHRIFGTNLIYRSPELLSRPWYIDVDISKYLSYIIYSIHQERSIHMLLDPAKKIEEFLKENQL